MKKTEKVVAAEDSSEEEEEDSEEEEGKKINGDAETSSEEESEEDEEKVGVCVAHGGHVCYLCLPSPLPRWRLVRTGSGSLEVARIMGSHHQRRRKMRREVRGQPSSPLSIEVCLCPLL